ncbi:lymphocyte function-associated antigen 3-like isoform X1 [Anguilla rostrata]|uniref:lymphocyte function-associated antigen 3-like isoform X1 n=1 Tax=Anguilla rostrata TaxID=7938 RepID=UPI0030CC65FF
MAGKHYIITAFSFLIAKFTFGEVTSINYGLPNGSITLKANVSGIIEEILWKWNGHKVFELDQISRDEYGQFIGRIDFDSTTGDLTISGLTESDSGIYRAEAHVQGKLQYSQHSVEIIDPVTDPIVTCQKSGSMLTLICASDLSPLTVYSWEGPKGPMLSSGSELHLESAENGDSVYTCVVKNPASESREAFALHRCFSAQGSIVINLAISFGVISVVLGVLIGILVYCKKRDRGLNVLSCIATASQRLVTIHKEKEDTTNETPAEIDPFIVEEKAELDHEKNNLEEGNLREQEDTSNSVRTLVSLPGHGGDSIEQGGVSNEQGVLNNEDNDPQEEPASGTGNEEDPSHTRQESPNIAGAQVEEIVEDPVAKCQEENLPNPLSEPPGTFDDAEPLPGPQV